MLRPTALFCSSLKRIQQQMSLAMATKVSLVFLCALSGNCRHRPSEKYDTYNPQINILVILQSESKMREVQANVLRHNAATCREHCLRQQGFVDIFKSIKAEENDKALALLPGVLK